MYAMLNSEKEDLEVKFENYYHFYAPLSNWVSMSMFLKLPEFNQYSIMGVNQAVE